MKEKDFFGVVSAIAQFIEKADNEPEVNKNQFIKENTEAHRKEKREDEPNHGSSK